MVNPLFEASSQGQSLASPKMLAALAARTARPGTAKPTTPVEPIQETPEENQEPGVMSKIGGAALNTVAAVGNILDLPGSSIRDTLSGKNPFDQWLDPMGRNASENRVSGRDMLRRAGVVSAEDNWKNFIGGIGLEIALDPTTYMGIGALSRAGNAFRNIGVNAKKIRPLAKEMAEVGSGSAGGKAKASTWIGGKVAAFTQTPKQVLAHAENLLAKRVKPSVDGTIEGTFKEATGDSIAFSSKDELDKMLVEETKSAWAMVDDGGKLEVYKNPKESTEWKIDPEATRLANQAVSQTVMGATSRQLRKKFIDAHKHVYGKGKTEAEYAKLLDSDMDSPLRSLVSVGLPFMHPAASLSAPNPEKRWENWLNKQPDLPEANVLEGGPPPSNLDIPPSKPRPPKDPAVQAAEAAGMSAAQEEAAARTKITPAEGKSVLKQLGKTDMDIDAIGDENIIKEVSRYGLLDSKGKVRQSIGENSKRVLFQAAKIFGPAAATAFPVIEAMANTWAKLNNVADPDEYFKRLAVATGDVPADKLGKWTGTPDQVITESGTQKIMRMGERVITAMKGVDGNAPTVSTFMHEVGHDARAMFDSTMQKKMEDAVGKYMLDNKIKTPLLDDTGRWTVEAEEIFANGFEAYLATGKAPFGTGLNSVYQKLKDWITDIWAKIKGDPKLESYVHPQLKQVFDEMIKGPPKAKGAKGSVPVSAAANAADAVDGQAGDAAVGTKPLPPDQGGGGSSGTVATESATDATQVATDIDPADVSPDPQGNTPDVTVQPEATQRVEGATPFNIEQIKQAASTEPIGVGGNARVYSIDDSHVIRVPKQVKGEILDDFKPIEHPLTKLGIEAGQEVAENSQGVTIRQKQIGEEAGLAIPKQVPETRRNELYKSRVIKAADMPQEAYNKLAENVKRINESGYGIDPSKSSNVLIDSDNGKFNLVDVSENKKGLKQGLNDIVVMLMGNTYFNQFEKTGEDLTDAYRKIFDKASEAVRKAGASDELTSGGQWSKEKAGYGKTPVADTIRTSPADTTVAEPNVSYTPAGQADISGQVDDPLVARFSQDPAGPHAAPLGTKINFKAIKEAAAKELGVNPDDVLVKNRPVEGGLEYYTELKASAKPKAQLPQEIKPQEITVYHGTNAEFDEFKDTGTTYSFSTDKGKAGKYSESRARDEGGSPRVMERKVVVNKVFDTSNPEDMAKIEAIRGEPITEIEQLQVSHLDDLKSMGYDAIKHNDEIQVFDRSQIKKPKKAPLPQENPLADLAQKAEKPKVPESNAIQEAAKEPTPIKEIPYSKNQAHNKELNRIHQSLAKTVGDDAAKAITPLVQEFVEAGNSEKVLTTTIESMSPEEMAGLAAKIAADKDGAANELLQIAYHGTPHVFGPEMLVRMPDGSEKYLKAGEAIPEGAEAVQNFPLGRFDLSRVSTGEGRGVEGAGQAYGFGAYAAQREGLARDYKKTLAGGGESPSYKGKYRSQTEDYDISEILLEMHRGASVDDAIKKVIKDLEDYANKYSLATAKKNAADRIEAVRKLDKKDFKHDKPGALYKLEVPEDEDVMFWDKPFSEQPPKVQEGLKKLGVENKAATWNKQFSLLDGITPLSRSDEMATVFPNKKNWVDDPKSKLWTLGDDIQSSSHGKIREMDGEYFASMSINGKIERKQFNSLRDAKSWIDEQDHGWEAWIQGDKSYRITEKRAFKTAEDARKWSDEAYPPAQLKGEDVYEQLMKQAKEEQRIKPEIRGKIENIKSDIKNLLNDAPGSADEAGDLIDNIISDRNASLGWATEELDAVMQKGLRPSMDDYAWTNDTTDPDAFILVNKNDKSPVARIYLEDKEFNKGTYTTDVDGGANRWVNGLEEAKETTKVDAQETIFKKMQQKSRGEALATTKKIFALKDEIEKSTVSDFAAKKAASKKLLSVGIKGNAVPENFRAGGSRKGNYNFVVFDDKDVKILDRLEQGGKGSVTFKETGEAAIKIVTGKGDASTAVHELAHVFRRNLKAELSERAEKALEQQLKDEDTIKNILGGKSDAVLKDASGSWTREAEEVWARLFEKYIREGKAPTSALKEAFEALKKMMVNVYKTLTKNPEINGKINPELRAVFDEMLGGAKKIGAPKKPVAINPIAQASEVAAKAAPPVSAADEFALRGDLPKPRDLTTTTDNPLMGPRRTEKRISSLDSNGLIEAAAPKPPMARGPLARRAEAPKVDQAAVKKNTYVADDALDTLQGIAATTARKVDNAADTAPQYIKDAESILGKVQGVGRLVDINSLPPEKKAIFEEMLGDASNLDPSEIGGFKKMLQEAAESAAGRQLSEEEIQKVSTWLGKTSEKFQSNMARMDSSFDYITDKVRDATKDEVSKKMKVLAKVNKSKKRAAIELSEDDMQLAIGSMSSTKKLFEEGADLSAESIKTAIKDASGVDLSDEQIELVRRFMTHDDKGAASMRQSIVEQLGRKGFDDVSAGGAPKKERAPYVGGKVLEDMPLSESVGNISKTDILKAMPGASEEKVASILAKLGDSGVAIADEAASADEAVDIRAMYQRMNALKMLAGKTGDEDIAGLVASVKNDIAKYELERAQKTVRSMSWDSASKQDDAMSMINSRLAEMIDNHDFMKNKEIQAKSFGNIVRDAYDESQMKVGSGENAKEINRFGDIGDETISQNFEANIVDKSKLTRELFKSAPTPAAAAAAKITHEYAKAPWGDIINHIKGEDALQTLMQAMDVGGTLIAANPATRTMLRLFDAEVMGTGTMEEQDLARNLYRAYERSVYSFREIMHPIVHYTGRSNIFNQKQIAIDLMKNKNMDRVDALKEAGRIANERNSEMRKFLEFDEATANDGLPYKLDRKIFDQPEEEVARLETWLRSVGKLLEDALKDSKASGLSSKQLVDEMIKYAPRSLADPGQSVLQKKSNMSLLDASQDSQIARDEHLKNLPSGTAVLDTLSLDEAISGIAYDQKILGEGLDKGTMDYAVEYLKDNYLDQLLSEKYFDEAGEITEEGTKKLQRIASTIANLPKSHVEQQIPMYGNNFLRDLSMYFENNYLKQSVALAAQGLAIRNITSGGDQKYLLSKLFSSASMDNHTAYMNVIRKTGRLGDYQNYVKSAFKDWEKQEKIFVKPDGMIEFEKRTLSPEQLAEEQMFAKKYADEKEIGVSKETFEAANYWLQGFMRPQELTVMKQIAATMLNAFKSMVTVPFPSFHGRNKTSGWAMNFFFGAKDPTAPIWDAYTKTERQAFSLRNGQPVKNIHQELPDQLVQDILGGGSKQSGIDLNSLTPEQKDAIVTDWVRSQVFKFGLVGDRMGVAAERIGDTVSSLVSQSPGTITKDKNNWFGFKNPLTDPTSTTWQKLNPTAFGGAPYPTLDKTGARPKVDIKTYDETTNVIGAAGSEFGAMVEETNRVSPFLAYLKQGMSPEEAARMTHMVQFDYSRLTSFEKTMKQFVPFYVFASKALKLTISDLLTNPGGKQAWSIRAAARAQDTEEPMPEHIRRGLAIPLGKGEDGESRYISGLGLAWEDPLEMLSFIHGDGKATATAAFTKLRPEAQALGEMAFGRSAFFDRGFNDMDPQLGRLRDNLTGNSGKGLAEPLMGSQSLEFLVGKTPATRVVSTANKAFDDRKNTLEKFLNLGTGVQITDVNAEAAQRIRLNELNEQLKDLGGRELRTTYIPDWKKERMSQEETKRAEDLKRMINAINSEVREKKKLAQVQSLRSAAEGGSE